MSHFRRKSLKIIAATFAVYALLVSTHEGEFWPFSIYPMFSQAGNPWTRALVTDVTSEPDSLIWQISDAEDVRGNPVAVRSYGVDQIDFANYISKTRNWTDSRKMALIHMFGRNRIGDDKLMILKIRGHLDDGEIHIQATPFLLMSKDSVQINPLLSADIYHSQTDLAAE